MATKYYRREYEIKVGDKIYTFSSLRELRKFIKKPEIGIKIKDYKIRRTIYSKIAVTGTDPAKEVYTSVKEFYLWPL